MTIDQSRIEFDEFKKEWEKFKEKDLTEADTRSKVLDYLFLKILGWREEEIDREKYVQVGYYDYLFSIPGFQFVIEAKKNFVDFKLPNKHKSSTLNSLLKGNKEVISQIRAYMFEVGVQYGVISNGRQFIIGKFVNSDGTDWKKNKCIIYHDINDLEDRFIDFYNLLARDSVIENGTILIEEEKEIGRTIYSSLSGKNGEIVRNSLSSELTPVLDKVFGEIYKYEVLDNKELIKECFIENKEIKKNKSDIEKLFADKPPNLSEVSGARNTQSIVNQISEEFKNQPIGLRDTEPPRPILIIGSKGAGKTTFINYLFKSAIDNNVLKRRPSVYIDFRKYVDDDLGNINQKKIYKDIISDIQENNENLELYTPKILRRIYLKEIKENHGIWSLEGDEKSYNSNLKQFLSEQLRDPENHFVKLSHYFLRERSRRLTLIIDNADQFDLAIQKKVFLLAQSLNRKAKCAIVLSLREGYYYEWRNKPPFDAFVNNVYHITAPPYSEVLQKRIDYALNHVNIEGKSKGVVGSLNFELNNESVKGFLLGLKTSLFGKDNSEMLEFLEETTYPNLREGLNVFRDFLLSGHTEVSEYVIRQSVSPESTESIPFWEFLKAIALLNKKYYSHHYSSIHNLFSPSSGNSMLFLKVELLRFLFERIEKYGQAEKFIETSQLLEEFTGKGYKLISIINELNELLEFRLVDTDDSSSDKEFNTKLNNHKSISISLKGKYYLETLLTRFSYIELCLQDTPIYGDENFNRIKESFPLSNENGKRNLSKRYENVLLFLEYLENREKIELKSTKIIQEMKNNGLTNGLKRVKRTVERLQRIRNQR